jgi:hypothetical protein
MYKEIAAEIVFRDSFPDSFALHFTDLELVRAKMGPMEHMVHRAFDRVRRIEEARVAIRDLIDP